MKEETRIKAGLSTHVEAKSNGEKRLRNDFAISKDECTTRHMGSYLSRTFDF